MHRNTRFWTALILGAFACSATSARAALVVPDIALIGYRSQNVDEFSIVALNAIANGEEFFFVDGSVAGTSVQEAENVWRFNATTTISPGTVITFSDIGSSWSPSSGGTVTSILSGAYSNGLSDANIGGSDDFLLFDSTNGAATTANSTNLFYLDSNDNGTIATNAAPLGLSDSSGVVNRGAGSPLVGSNVRYDGSLLVGDAATLFAAISDDSNWEAFTPPGGNGGTGGSLALPIATTGFTVTSATVVPEPSSLAIFSVFAAAIGSLYLVRSARFPAFR